MLTSGTMLQGRYRIVRKLAQGGMGTVYEAMDERLDTRVALKETAFAEEELRAQFEREARLLARLHHPALPRVSDHFNEDDGQFLVMQFIAGDDLEAMRSERGGSFPAAEVLAWADQLLDALDYLHTQEQPIIHRDIKPQNLKLTARGQIILLDFGLAKGYASMTSPLTPSASVVGYTPTYAPLEQIQGAGTDARSDLYSLAASLYHLLTGTAPPNALTRADAVINGEPDPLRPADELTAQASKDVAAVLRQAMALRRDQRISTAAAMRRALREADKTPSLPAHPGGMATVAMSPHPTNPIRQDALTLRNLPPSDSDQVSGADVDVSQEGSVGFEPEQQGAEQPTGTHARPLIPTPPPQARKRNMLLVGGLASLLLLVGLAVGGFALYRLSQKGEKSVTNAPRQSASPPSDVQAGGGGADASEGQKILKGHTKAVSAVALSPDGKTLASGSWDGSVRLWEVETGKFVRTVLSTGRTVSGVAFSPDGATLAVAMYDGTEGSDIVFLDSRSWEPSKTMPKLKGLGDLTGAVAFSPDGERLFGTIGSRVKIWNLQTGEDENTVDGNSNPVFAVSRDGSLLAMASSNENDVQLHDIHTAKLRHTLAGHTKGLLALAFSPTGTLASGSYDGTTRLWDAATGETLQTLKENETDAVFTIAFSPDGQTVATGSYKTVRLWDARNGEMMRTLSVEQFGIVRMLAFSPDGKMLACGSESGAVILFDLSRTPATSQTPIPATGTQQLKTRQNNDTDAAARKRERRRALEELSK